MNAYSTLVALRQEKVYFTRLLHLITDAGTKVLREVFLKEIPVDRLQQTLYEEQGKLLPRLNQNPLWKIKVYPEHPQVTDPNTYDISLLAFLVSILCTGLDQDKQDSVKAIRENRNTFIHDTSRAWLSKNTFDLAWESVTDAILNLGSLVQSEYPNIREHIANIQEITVYTEPSDQERHHASPSSPAAAADFCLRDNLQENPKQWVQQRFRALKEELYLPSILSYLKRTPAFKPSLGGFNTRTQSRRKKVAAFVAYLLTQSEDTLRIFLQYLEDEEISVPSTPAFPGNIKGISEVSEQESEDLIRTYETLITQKLSDAEELADYQLEAELLCANKYIDILQLPCSGDKASSLLEIVKTRLPLSFRLFFYSLKEEKQNHLVIKFNHAFRSSN